MIIVLNEKECVGTWQREDHASYNTLQHRNRRFGKLVRSLGNEEENARKDFHIRQTFQEHALK